jgi:hypothetical protein
MATLTSAPYGIAIPSFIATAIVLVAVERLHETPIARAAVALFVLGAAAYTLSAWNLSSVSQSVINMETLKPAIVYPFVTGLRFIPGFVQVMPYWVIGIDRDRGLRDRSFYRTLYWVSAAAFIALTVTAVALGYGDYQIWVSGLPERGTILVCYGFVLAINVAVVAVAFRRFNEPCTGGYSRLWAMCMVALATVAVPAIVIDHEYDEVNRQHLDKRRAAAYVALNPEAILEYRRLAASGQAANVGPDFLQLVKDDDFERALRADRFYRQNFDEPFQVSAPSVIFAYRRRTPDTALGGRQFVFVRLPGDLVRALRFQVVMD